MIPAASTPASYPWFQDLRPGLIEEEEERYNPDMAPGEDETGTLSPADLSRRAREILDRVRRGEPVVIDPGGEARAVRVDDLGYRLLRALASAGPAEQDSVDSLPEPLSDTADSAVLRGYLAGEISLGKAAELLDLSRFELEERFRQLGVPLRLGAGSIDDAKAEVAAARRPS